MKLIYTTANPRIKFELEVPTGKEAFRMIAVLQSLFEEKECGCCKSKNIVCGYRKVEENDYFNWACADCGAQLDIGQNKDGKGLFVKRWDKDTKQNKPNNGWYIYQGRATGYTPPATRPQQPAKQQDARDSYDTPVGGGATEEIPF